MLAASFNQVDLSQLIISSLEPWAPSMIALSINASMIYFDGASNDKCLVWVSASSMCLCARRQPCSSLHTHTVTNALCGCVCRYVHAWPCPCVPFQYCRWVCVHACSNCVHVRVPSGVLNQFCLNWERHLVLLCMSVQRPFIVGLLHNPQNLSVKGSRSFWPQTFWKAEL